MQGNLRDFPGGRGVKNQPSEEGSRVRPLVGETEIPRAHAAWLEKPDRLKDEDAAPPK